MVLPQFSRLSTDKQARIETALLNEFSHYPLPKAQVARIVKQSEISRGAFYQYFSDLLDAYQYLFGQAMQTIHSQLPDEDDLNIDKELAATKSFLSNTENSIYREFIQMHFAYNENALSPQASHQTGNPRTWATTVLTHTTIRDILLEPETTQARLSQLEEALLALKEA